MPYGISRIRNFCTQALYIYEAYCIAHLSLCAGQPPMGALLSKRNSINYAIEANTLQLIKREINIFCAEETNNLAT